MSDTVRRLSFSGRTPADAEALLAREWLVANGLGGYARGTISGVVTRRYHGILVSALPAPPGRTVDVEIDPAGAPAYVFRIRRYVRTERGFEYSL